MDIAADLAFEAGGADAALAAIEVLAERAHDAGLAAFDGQFAAHRAWRAAALPTEDSACLRFRLRGWRETEALACARIRLLAARGDVPSAMRLEHALASAAADVPVAKHVQGWAASRTKVSSRCTTRLSPSWARGAKADGSSPRWRVAHPAAIARTQRSRSSVGARRGVIAPVVRRAVRQTVACATTADIEKGGTNDDRAPHADYPAEPDGP